LDLVESRRAAQACEPVVTPFSPNAIAAESLVGEREDDLLTIRDGQGPHLILAGDHQLLDAIMLEASQRWRVRILRDLEEPADGRNSDAARYLARLVSAHSVADDGELELRREEKRVLVVVSLAPDVGRAGEFERHRDRA